MSMTILNAGKKPAHDCKPFDAVATADLTEGMILRCDVCGQVWHVTRRRVYGGWSAERVPSNAVLRWLKLTLNV